MKGFLMLRYLQEKGVADSRSDSSGETCSTTDDEARKKDDNKKKIQNGGAYADNNGGVKPQPNGAIKQNGNYKASSVEVK